MKLLLLSYVLAISFASVYPRSIPKRQALPEGLDEATEHPKPATGKKVATAWYPGWSTAKFPPSAIPFDKYTHLSYSFAITTPDVNVLSLNASDEKSVPGFVDACHEHDVKALVSIGGFTGSRYFSTNVGSAENRTAFVKTVVDMATKYSLDGLDFDWEYPNHQGIGCNIINANDTSNFLLFLQQLRADPVGAKLIVTAATATVPFWGADGKPSASVAGFSQVLDYVAIMNYDVWGSWSTAVGPNAPLDDSCASAENQQGSAVSAVAAWTKAGIPANQLVLGVPAYGHSFHVEKADAYVNATQMLALNAYPKFDAKQQPLGEKGDGPTVDVCGVKQGPTGYFSFGGLVEAGFLKEDGNPAEGISYRYDQCSKTPYIYNPQTQVMVSYDNVQSFGEKGKFIKDSGLLGYAMWDVSGDYNSILADSIREAAGY